MNDLITGSIIGSSGVALGAIIGLIGNFANSITEYKKWKVDKKYNHLIETRNKTEKTFNDVYEKIIAGMKTDSYDISAMTTIFKLCPKEVSEEFLKFMDDKNRSIENRREHLLLISISMKEYLSSLDKKIYAVIDK
ncbi:MAG: hypothetical protein WC947_01975 [Elusimicrobiota bacterium]